jgi:hypothetical protein
MDTMEGKTMSNPFSKSRLSRTTPVALAFWLCSVFAAPQVWACCDDVFSCAAAVATAGATCVIDEAENALRGLIQRVGNERELKRQEFANELESAQREAQVALLEKYRLAQQRADDLRQYLAEAKRITGEDKLRINNALNDIASQQMTSTRGLAAVSTSSVSAFKQLQNPGVTSVNKPIVGASTERASSGTTIQAGTVTIDKASAWNETDLQLLRRDTSLETLLRQIEVEQHRGEAACKQAELAKRNAEFAIAQSKQNTLTVFQKSFLGPVDQLLAALQAMRRNPLNAGQLIAGALGILDGALFAFDRDVVPATERDAQVKQTAVANVKREADETQRHADTAKHILAEMRRGALFTTMAERRVWAGAASVTVPMSAVTISPVVTLKSPYRLLAMSKSLRTDLVTVRPHLERLATQMQRPDLAPIRAKLATGFDQYFKGKQPAETRQIRDQLIFEARRRYSADQTLLASIEQLINKEARARGVF